MTPVDTSLTAQDAGGARALSSGSFVSSVVLSYIAAALIVVWLIYVVDYWDFLAATRFLDLLLATGIVQFHDAAPSPFTVPNVKLFFKSQHPLDYRVLGLAVSMFVGFTLIKAVQFSSIARAFGVKGSIGQHVRAYLFGDGVDRFLPYYVGSVGTASALAKQGASFERALSAMVVSHAFMIFEIVVFAVVCVFFVGWSIWLSQLVWPIVILGVVYLIMRAKRGSAASSVADDMYTSFGRRTFVVGARSFRILAREEPGLLLKLCLLSVLAFALLDLAVYLVVEGFNTPARLYTSDFSLLLLGVVGAYIARLIPITPGGIGQWELGFAAGFYVYGSDISFNLLLAAVLASVLRTLVGMLLLGIVVVFYGMPTDLRSVIRIFRGAESPPGSA
jgi:hypothetical protein